MNIFGKDWPGDPFFLFGPGHLLALAVIFLVNILIVTWGQRSSEKARKIMRWSLVGVLIVDEALWHLWNATTGQGSLQTSLPFHLCSVFVFLSAFMLVSRNYNIYEYAYFLGIAGATQALLTPDAGMYGFPHFRTW